MLYFVRIDISKGIYPTKSSIKSRECMICHYWFFNHGFNCQYSICNGCHDLSVLYLKVGLSLLFYLLPLKTFKNYEKCFLFHLKSSFHSQDV